MDLTRRQLLGTGAAALTALGLTGCGSQLPEPDVARSGFGQDASGTVRFWCRAATLPASQLVVDLFHRAQHRVRIDLTAIPDTQYVTKLATSIRGRAVPDLVAIDDINSQLFIYRDAFTDLTPLVADLPYRDQLSPGHLGLGTFRGRHYGVPYVGDLSVLFYNKALFRRAGLDPATPPSDFASLLSAARAVNGLGSGIKGYSFGGNSAGIMGFTSFPNVWATGSRLLAGPIGRQHATVAGNEPLRRTLELYRTLWSEQLVPRANRTQDGSTWGKDFLAGQVGIFPGSYGVIVLNANKDVLPQIGVAPLPGPDGGTSMFGGGDNFGIPRGAPNASGAWQFVRFALDTAQQAQLPRSGYTPVRSDALSDAFRRAFPLDVVPLQNLTRAYAQGSLAYNTAINQADSPWFTMFQRAVYDGDVDGALREGQSGFAATLHQAQV